MKMIYKETSQNKNNTIIKIKPKIIIDKEIMDLMKCVWMLGLERFMTLSI